MSIYRELAYDRVISGIKGIQFCILSEQDIRRRSVVEVTENQTFMGNEPVQNGLFDLRMGVVDGSRVCATCQQRNTFCPGHFGHIALARPVFYVQFFDVVRKLMKCTCFRCSRILVDLDGPEARRILSRKISRQKRWDAMSKLCAKVRRCGQDTVDGCGAKVPDKVVKTEDMRLKLVWKDAEGGGGATNGVGREIVFNAEDVLRVLRRMSDLDCEALGFSAEHNRPERMICTVLPVPPPAVRPSVRHETGQRQEDDLTHKLSDIIKRNNLIKDCIARGTTTYHTIETMHVPLLQYHVATLIDNSITTMYQAKDRAGRAFRSLTERLKHKEGRIRGNLMGKRVDFSARTVITPDPNLSIDELGVPLKIAMNLTFPDVVGPSTRAELQRLVLAGADVYPGAKQVRKTNDGNRTIRLRGHPDPASIVLEDGDIVERHLLNGDYVLFNRQPSLHKMSMMAHRVRVMPYNTFRLNVLACASYNADFDGDEMNMHVPQSLQTLYELKELAAVPLHVLSPRYCWPIISIVQDVALGVFRITQPGVSVSQRQLYNLSCGNQLLGGFVTTQAGRARDADAEIGQRWTGREVLSTVLPPTASIRMKTEDDPSKFVSDVHDIRVVDGIIKSGVLSEKVFSKASTGLVHSTYNTLGPQAVVAMLNSTQKLICDWLVLSGFSVGVADMVINQDTIEKKAVKISSAKTDVLELLRKVHAGTFENNSTKTNADMLEEKIGGILSGAANDSYKLCRSGFNIGNNRLLNMIESGSKGRAINFQQMTACLGPQSIEGRRVTDGFNGRTLPHFTKYDDGPEARGFVEHSFIEGLTPQEFFFHSMAGRIGLIDTAVRSVTWETPIVVVEAGKPKRVLIGEWIDGLLAEDAKSVNNRVKRYPEDRDMELLELEQEVFIPTADASGKVTWGALTAVTRHDPSEKLYKVETAGGREVTVADSNSLLIWKPESKTFEPTHSAEVKVGDFVPVTASLPEAPESVRKTYVDLSEYVDMSEYIFGDRFELNEYNGQFIGIFLADGYTCINSGTVGITNNEKAIQDFVKGWFENHGFFAHLHDDLTIVGYGYQDLLGCFLDAFVGKGSEHKYVPEVAYVAPLEFVRGILAGYFSGNGSVLSSGISSSSVSQKLTEGIAAMCTRLGAFSVIRSIGPPATDGWANALPAHRLYVCSSWLRRLADQLNLIHPEKAEKLRNVRCTEVEINYATQKDVVLDTIVSIEEEHPQHPKLYDVTVPSTINFTLANGLTVFDTSETGYLQRRLVKAMEDCKIHHDLTVRNANNFIIQFLYGEDGMDAIKLEYHDMKHVLGREPADLRNDFLLVDPEADLKDHVTPEVLAKMKKESGAYYERCTAHFKTILEDRRKIIMGLYKGLQENLPIVYPVNVQRLVEQAASLHAKSLAVSSSSSAAASFLSDLDPLTILDRIEQLSKDLVVGGAASLEDFAGMRWMPVILRVFLSPKQILRKHRLNRAAFDRVCAAIRKDFYGAVAHPGEMVGICGASSLSEPCTQLSTDYKAHLVVLRSGKEPYSGPIGALLDSMVSEDASRVVDLGGGSVVLDPIEDMYIVGVSNEEKTSWRRIQQISRHPANGGMVRITTSSGKTTCCTLSHSFLKRTERGIAPVLGSDLKLGDRVPVASFIPTAPAGLEKTTIRIGSLDVQLTRDFGWLCGAYAADGRVGGFHGSDSISISKVIPEYQDKLRQVYADIFGLEMHQIFKEPNQHKGNILHGWEYPGTENIVYSAPLVNFFLRNFNTGSFNKRLPAWAFASTPEFISGLLCGYFDGDGNINCDIGKQMMRTASVSEKLTEDFVLLLARVGIFGSKCRERHLKEKDRNDLHTIQISRKHAQSFKDRVGPLVVKTKADALDEIIKDINREDKHDTKEYIDQIPELGNIVASIGKTLELEGQSRLYGRWTKKAAIGRETLNAYIPIFEEGLSSKVARDATMHQERIRIFEEVYTFDARLRPSEMRHIHKFNSSIIQVPPELMKSFMKMATELLGFGKLCTSSDASKYSKTGKIKMAELISFLEILEPASDARKLADAAAAADIRDDKLPVIYQAVNSDVIWDEITKIEVLPDPGEMVYDLTVPGNDSFMVDCGILVHNTLNTFHTSGIGAASTVTRGVPRMKELMSMSKNIKTPSMKIRLRREWATSQERTQAILSTLETTHFRDVVKRSSIHFDPSDANTRIPEDEGLMAFYKDFGASIGPVGPPPVPGTAPTNGNASCPWVLRFEFDRMKMLNLQVTMLDLEYALVDHFDDAVTCVLSDDNADRLVCRLRLNAFAEDGGENGDLLTEIKALEQAVMDNLVIKGIKGIKKAMPLRPSTGLKKYDPVSDAYVMDDEWYIETAGSNLMEVLCHPCVDYTRTMTNDVYEAYLVLGIEAARQAVIDEMRVVLDSTPIDHRHLSLLADTMSNRGFFMSIDRHGINNRGELGPLAKCSFEQSTDMLIKAGMFAERDRINGVSANIMLGQVAPCGTGDCQVLMDNERLATLGKPVSLEPRKERRQRSTAPGSAAASENNPLSTLVELPELEVEGEDAEKKKAPAAPPGGRRKKVEEIEIV